MGLSLNNIYQRPYVKPDERQLVKKREDEEKSSAAGARSQEEAGQNSRSKGLQYVEQKQPTYTPAYEQKFSIPAQNAYNNVNITPHQAVTPAVNDGTASAVVSNKINIAQILKDFKNTAIAIGTPDELNGIIDNYLKAVEQQVKKEGADNKLVKSTLKGAASILDRHISETLGRDSNVVENWVDTLFMQQINLRYNEGEINERFLVKFPENEQAQSAEVKPQSATEQIEPEFTHSAEPKLETSQNTLPQPGQVKIPQDKQLKSLFIQAKKYAYANSPQKAIKAFEQALNRAMEIDDTETSGKIYYEVGKIYDDYDYLSQALKSYNQSIKLATDENVIAKAHYSMAQIYDDTNQITPAVEHYISTVSHAGEAENLPAQSVSLTKIGNIYTDMYDKEAFEYYDTASSLAQETDSPKLRGYVSSSQGSAYKKFDQPQKALTSYSKAAQEYDNAHSPAKTAQTYLSAADIMVGYNNLNKAYNLLTKAKKFARQTDNVALLSEIDTKMKQLDMYR